MSIDIYVRAQTHNRWGNMSIQVSIINVYTHPHTHVHASCAHYPLELGTDQCTPLTRVGIIVAAIEVLATVTTHVQTHVRTQELHGRR